MGTLRPPHGRKVLSTWIHQTLDSQLAQREGTENAARHHRGQSAAKTGIRQDLREHSLKSRRILWS